MSGSKTLRRLARIRELEEEQSRLLLEAAARSREEAVGELLAAHQERRDGRADLVRGVERDDVRDRVTGLVRMETALRRTESLRPRLDQLDRELASQREEYLARRTARRQVETLLSEAELLARQETDRRAQQMLDDWFGRKRRPVAGTGAEEDCGSGKAGRA
jgi:flagellar biosynthesis chaperone FliJ